MSAIQSADSVERTQLALDANCQMGTLLGVLRLVDGRSDDSTRSILIRVEQLSSAAVALLGDEKVSTDALRVVVLGPKWGGA